MKYNQRGTGLNGYESVNESHNLMHKPTRDMTSARNVEMINLTRSLQADLAEIDLFCKQVRAIMDENEGLRKHIFAVQLLLRESLTNAVAHGSQNDPAKKIECSLFIDQESKILIIEVCDQGEGFDWQVRSKFCSKPADTCGRGIDIMKRYSHELYFNEAGNKLIIKRRV